MTKPDTSKLNAVCLILAGGEGRRLSPDKPLLEVAGRPIIERVASVVTPIFREVVVVTNTPEKYHFLGLPHVPDRRIGCGPLMGIYSGLLEVDCETVFACAADMPFLDGGIIRSIFSELGDFQIVVPVPHGIPEFLHAYYTRACLPTMQRNLESGVFKIESLQDDCRVRRLDREWFVGSGLGERLNRAFANINTPEEYGRFGEASGDGEDWSEQRLRPGENRSRGQDVLEQLQPGIVEAIRSLLVDQETAYHRRSTSGSAVSSLWAHSRRVGLVAHHLALEENADATAALLAGLMHDLGKFPDGKYHEDSVPEEDIAADLAGRFLEETPYENLVPTIRDALLSLYKEVTSDGPVARVVYDADRLDKLGCMGVVHFFTKSTLRNTFLDNDLIIQASVELTYAFHAPDTIKTRAGRQLARVRSLRTRRFYENLLEEWETLGLGRFSVREEDIEGVTCVLVVPEVCTCGVTVDVRSDMAESVKCRSAQVEYRCSACGRSSRFSFCLPNVKALPRVPRG